MKKFQIPVWIEEYRPDELPENIQKLKKAAEKARDSAYAPYSHFKVGTAILLGNGIIVTGNNQENAAFPSGMCAERVAIWSAGSNYPGQEIISMYISAKSETKKVDQPVPPCGACRQAIAEYETKQNKPIEIYFSGETGPIWKTDSLENILPLVFSGKELK